jgi:GT2 family glycosyltransferase
MERVTLSAVIVAHDSLEDLRVALPRLREELQSGDEIIVVDNGPQAGLQEELAHVDPQARVVHPEGNVGFAAGANRGAEAATGDLLVLLNPDAIVQPGWGRAIRGAWGQGWAAWMALVLLADGRSINTSGGVLHFTGFGWAGQVDQPASAGPMAPTEVAFLSGACLAVPREDWNAAGGFSDPYFMYCEDVDISLRLRLRGGALAVIPDARVAHSYHFVKGADKWRMLERNRWATIIRTYPAAVLVAAMPALLVAEVAVWTFAFQGRWARMKAVATLEVIGSLPRLLRERRSIQATRRIDAASFAAHLTADLSSPYLGGVGRHPVIRGALALYWRVASVLVALIGSRSRSRDSGSSARSNA